MSRRLPAEPAKAPDRRGAVFVACAVAVFFGVLMYSSPRGWPIVVERLFIDGTLALLWIIAATGIGAAVLRVCRISCEPAALRFAASAGLGLGIIGLLVLGLGLCGWLNRATAIGLIALGILAAVAPAVPRLSRLKPDGWVPKGSPWPWLILAPSAAITTVAACMPAGFLWGDEPHPYDVVEYHLQAPREWCESGRITPLAHNVYSYFPFNVEMHYLLAMHLRGGPWKAMFLAQFMSMGFVVVTVVALAGTAGRQAAIVAAAVPWMTMLGSVAYNECGLLLFATLAVAWAIRARGLRDFVLAGAFAGFAAGTKLTAVPMLLGPVLVTLLLPRFGRDPGSIKAAAGFVLAAVLCSAPWAARNLAWTGNPVFPQGMSVFGRAHFTEVQQQRWGKAHSSNANQRLSAPWKQFAAEWKFGFVIIPLGIAAAALTRKRLTWTLVGVLVIQFVFWVGFTHVQGRFMVVAIPILAILIGQPEGKLWSSIVVAASVISVVVGWVPIQSRLSSRGEYLVLDDLEALMPEAAAEAMQNGRPLVLVGDAAAFRYPIPMTRLRYRTVFDVDVKPGQSLIDAWIGPDRPADAVILVTPSELRRFADTYWMIPRVQFTSDEPYVLPP
jgi:hypothetical protein